MNEITEKLNLSLYYNVIISVKLYNAIRSKVYNEKGDQFVTQK